MWPIAFLLLQGAAAQPALPTAYDVLRAEHARGADLATIRRAAQSGDSLLQRLAARAIGRMEQGVHEAWLRPLYRAQAPAVRQEAVNAAAQLKVVTPFAGLLVTERDPQVRSAIYESWGRASSVDAAAERALSAGLEESSIEAKRGAVRGLESYVRRTGRTQRPAASTVNALRLAVQTSRDREIRLAALLALTAAGDRDSAIVMTALQDADPQVRRAAVLMGRVWTSDTSALVRWQALRVAGSCLRARDHLGDRDLHVRLLAIDLIGELGCDPIVLLPLLSPDTPWRPRAHAVVALARRKVPAAASELARLAADSVWQARAWAAQGARLTGDSAILRRLANDAAPNVAIAAMHRPEDALRALDANHAGLVLAGAEWLTKWSGLRDSRERLMATFDRLAAKPITWRDPRVALLEGVGAVADSTVLPWVMARLADADPAVASVAARMASRITGRSVAPTTTALPIPSFPSAAEWAALRDATATVRIRDRGVIRIRLLVDDAPATVASFAMLARTGRYAGNTIHRIVPNFVIQGASPGADEYDPVTEEFLRDEVGFARHARGTLGISTRGRDTGDGQLFFNLVDNLRLDHDYTVFAETLDGVDVMDAINEGDIVESVTLETGALPGPSARDERPSTRPRMPASQTAGTLVVVHGGQLVTLDATGTTRLLTSGRAQYREPAWRGDTLHVAVEADGWYRLARLTFVGGRPKANPIPTPFTQGARHDVSPAPLPNGDVIFQRGLGADARLWVHRVDGTERRFVTREETARRPRVSMDGARVAWLAISESGRRVMVRAIDSSRDTTVFSDPGLEDVAWGPDGRLAVSTRTGTFVIPTEGQAYAHLVSRQHGELDWSAQDTLSIASTVEATVSYNGDPDRGIDRMLGEAASTGVLVRIAAPRPPDGGSRRIAVHTSGAQGARNVTSFDRVADRLDRLYFRSAEAVPRRATFLALRDRLRAEAERAPTDSALQGVVQRLLIERPALRTEATGRAAVSSAHPVATAAGLEILAKGGNVVDAAVAVSFALGVVEPDASGIGGYGQMVIARRGLPKPTLIEFMSRVPEQGGLSNTALLVNGRYPGDGPVLSNVPGTVAGMHLAWQRHGSGKVAWAALLAPAIRAAREGYEVSDGLATTLATEREHFVKYPGSRALFFRDGQPLARGDTLRNPDLAWVLEQIAAQGAAGFYTGEVARRWITDLRSHGSSMQLTDLARYFAVEREPVSGTYRGHTIWSSAPPVSGGADLVARLNLFEQYPTPKRYTEDAGTLHAALSAWVLTPSSRNRIADPAFWPVRVDPMTHKDTATVRWQCYSPNAALTPAAVRGDTLPCLPAKSETRPSEEAANAMSSACGEDHAAEVSSCHASGTTAFTVADADGNVVAVTQTLGTWGGTFHVTPGLGFLANDKLTSYPSDPAQYGARLPFARHGSTLAPTIVYKGDRPVFAVGAAGNAWITSAVYQSLIGALDFGLGPQAALELPRFLPGGGGPGGASGTNRFTIQLEDGFAPQVVQRLRTLGYDLQFISARGELREGYGAAIRINQRSVTAGADPRRSGAAGAIR